ncbi:hypothetical protein [Streptomyces sp. SudanB66_2053]|uniref:hypothetical protein n=1 Tax=Streptomyces sp. SudanB66_2053 TaxID=3035277 RepID=UPI003F5466D9
MLELPGWLEDMTTGIRLGEQAGIATGLPTKLAMFDERIAMLPLLRPGDNAVTASYVIHPSSLLDALAALFEAVEGSVQIRPSTPPTGEDPSELTPEEEKLLTLWPRESPTSRPAEPSAGVNAPCSGTSQTPAALRRADPLPVGHGGHLSGLAMTLKSSRFAWSCAH